MIHLDVFLIIHFCFSSTVSQWYRVMPDPHFTPISCKEQYVSSLLHCAALRGESKYVRFFFNILRPSIASSVYGNNHLLWGTGYATDGLHSFIKGTEIFASEWEIAPWIIITLDEPLQISFDRVYNREDSLGDRFHDVTFEVSMDGVSFEQRGFFKGPGVTGQVIEILFVNPTIGKFMRLHITQGSGNLVNLAEIEVYTK